MQRQITLLSPSLLSTPFRTNDAAVSMSFLSHCYCVAFAESLVSLRQFLGDENCPFRHLWQDRSPLNEAAGM
jgi:hypothetical protein